MLIVQELPSTFNRMSETHKWNTEHSVAVCPVCFEKLSDCLCPRVTFTDHKTGKQSTASVRGFVLNREDVAVGTNQQQTISCEFRIELPDNLPAKALLHPNPPVVQCEFPKCPERATAQDDSKSARGATAVAATQVLNTSFSLRLSSATPSD